MKHFVLFAFCFILSGCAGLNDSIEDLGDGYYCLSESKEDRFIYYNPSLSEYNTVDNILIFSTVLGYVYDDHFILANQKPSFKQHVKYIADTLTYTARAFYFADSIPRKEIPPQARKTVKQNISDSLFYRNINNQISQSNTMKDQEYFREIGDSILRNSISDSIYFSSEIKYWIIDKNRKITYGPFSESEFQKNKTMLGVPISLTLKH